MKKISIITILMVSLMFFVSVMPIKAMSLEELQNMQAEEIQETVESLDTLGTETEEQNGGPHYWPGKEPKNYETPSDSSEDALVQYMRGYKPVTEENMQYAATTLSPVVNAIGNLTGIIVVLTVALTFLTTALDLIYIAVPFTRGFLNPQDKVNVGQGMPMGMSMGLQQASQPEYGLRRKWVSDEASNIVRNLSGTPIASAPSISPVSMYGQPNMGMQQPQPMKVVIFEYMKARAIFLIVFAIATTLLLSSIFTDCGLNIAELGVKVMNRINSGIQGVNL